MMQHDGNERHGRANRQTAGNNRTRSFLFLERHGGTHGPAAPRVPETGCGAGRFARLLEEHGYLVHAVECPPEAAAETDCAAGFFQRMADLPRAYKKNDAALAFSRRMAEIPVAAAATDPPAGFDAVVLEGVPEHPAAAEELMQSLALRLKPDGVFIISVPCAAHTGMHPAPPDGQRQNGKSGITADSASRPRLRSLRKLLIKAGFGIERADHEYGPVHGMRASGLPGEPAPDASGGHGHPMRIVVRASRAALRESAFTAPPRNIVLLSRAPHIPCFQLRLGRPLRHYCDAVGGTVRIRPFCTREDLLWADLIVMQREPSPAMLQTVRKAHALGISIVYDMDDLLHDLPEFLSAFPNAHAPEMIRRCMADADLTTCSTARLQKEVAAFAGATALVPNCMYSPDTVSVESAQSDGPCTFVLASSDTVRSDWLRYPLRRLLRGCPGSSLVIVGKVGQEWQRANFPAAYYPLLSPEAFSALLRSLRNAVGIIPLDDSKFSSCKSAIKFYHYSLCGLVTVASNVPPYADEIAHGATGLLVENDPRAWLAALGSLAAAPDKRRLMLAKALRWCREHAGPERAAQAWKQAFHLLPRPDESLREQLRRKYPAVRPDAPPGTGQSR